MRKDEKQTAGNWVKPFLTHAASALQAHLHTNSGFCSQLPRNPSMLVSINYCNEKLFQWEKQFLLEVRMEDRLEIRQQTWLKYQRARSRCKQTHLHLDQTIQVLSKIPIFDLFEMACATWKGSLIKPGNNQNTVSVWAAQRVSFFRGG